MTIVIFTVIARNKCSAVSPLPEVFYANFGGDPFTGDAPHGMYVRGQVLHCNGSSCGTGTVNNRTTQRAPDVMTLKLHHKQMHYQQSPFLNVFTKKTTTKGVKNTLLGHEKLDLYNQITFRRGLCRDTIPLIKFR